MARIVTTADFIRKARERHGDKYDYSLVKYSKNLISAKVYNALLNYEVSMMEMSVDMTEEHNQ